MIQKDDVNKKRKKGVLGRLMDKWIRRWKKGQEIILLWRRS